MSSKDDPSMGEIWPVQISCSEDSEENITSQNNKNKRDDHVRYLRNILNGCLLIAFLSGIASCISFFTVPSLKKSQPMIGLEMWQWCLLITAILAGPVLSQAIGKLVLICTTRKLVNNSVFYLVILVENAWAAFYFGLIFLAWTWVNEPKYIAKNFPPQNKENLLVKFDTAKKFINSTLITVLLSSIFWFIKNILLLILEEAFRTKRFFQRIKESVFHEHWIKTLSQPSPLRDHHSKCHVIFQSKTIKGRNKIKVKIHLSELETLHKESVSRWMMKLIDDVIDERPLEYVVDGKPCSIDSKKEVVLAAQVIFSHLVVHGNQDHESSNTTITKEVLKQRLSMYFNNPNEVNKVIDWLLERARDNMIDEEVIKKCTVKAWKNRRSLLHTLRSNKILFQKFCIFVDAMLLLVILVAWLVMVKEEIRKAIVVVGSAIVGSAFIFGESLRKLFESFTFIFVGHPFDVGDYCLINDTLVQIHEIHLYSTHAFTVNDEKKYYPNSVLVGSTITNYTRSTHSHVADQVVFYLNFTTPQDKILKLKSRIKSVFKENPQDWILKHSLVMEFILQDSRSVIQATLRFKHNCSYDEFDQREERKAKLQLELKNILKEEELIC